MDRPSLMRLFSACDVNKSGRIEFGDFTAVCRELNVPESEIRTLFDRFDADEDGFIDYNEFSSRFQEVSQTLDVSTFAALTCSSPSRAGAGPWEDFVGRIDVEFQLSER
uniref:Ras and EF-hand domain-containing protein-like n=2 Tax=Cynoglossus semilaevis TaxID=244447 RepID=A0A3P8VC09_CYNSE